MSMPPAPPDLLADVRHDLKTPLCVVKGQAQLAARDVARVDGLTDTARAGLLARMEVIAAAVDAMTARLDADQAGDERPAGPRH